MRLYKIDNVTFKIEENRQMIFLNHSFVDEDTLNIAKQVTKTRNKICPYQIVLDSTTIVINDLIQQWIEENTTGVWCHILLQCYKFENELDAIAFKLRWYGSK